MPKTHTVAVFPDGSLEYTRNAALTALFGDVGEMRRVSDIQKLPNEAMFYIKWLHGPNKGKSATWAQHVETIGADILPEAYHQISAHTGTLFFYTYEDAVVYEVQMISELRRRGVTFR